jgi:hypothetical protein
MVNGINPSVRKRIGWKIKVVLRRVRGNTTLVVGATYTKPGGETSAS